VGRGDQRPLRELAERTGVSDQVSFAGFLGSAGDVAREMLKAHVFVMVSRLAADGTDIEGFGTVYLEAGALKRPAIAGRSGGAPEAVVHMQTGLLVDDPDSAAGIAETVAMLARQPGLVGALGEQAYQRVQAEVLWPDIAARLYGKLQTLVAARSG